jgi:hypothetical protein
MEQNRIESLGERIVKAARLAVAMHLYQAVAPDGQRERMAGEPRFKEPRLEGQSLRQRVVIGGAGPRIAETFSEFHDADLVTDDQLPPATGRAESFASVFTRQNLRPAGAGFRQGILDCGFGLNPKSLHTGFFACSTVFIFPPLA